MDNDTERERSQPARGEPQLDRRELWPALVRGQGGEGWMEWLLDRVERGREAPR